MRSRIDLTGKVTKSVFKTDLYDKYKQAVRDGADSSVINRLYKQAQKTIFIPNRLYSLLRKLGVDVKIPYLTGIYAHSQTFHNLVTTRGKQLAIELISGESVTPVLYMAIGEGTTSPAAGNTALEDEITTGGGERAAATVSIETTTTTNDTALYTTQFDFTDAFTVTEEGLFDDASAGNMLARHTFTGWAVDNGDTLVIEHSVQAS